MKKEELEQLKPVFEDMSELIQHEYDHLDGILATMRAIDSKSFVIKISEAYKHDT